MLCDSIYTDLEQTNLIYNNKKKDSGCLWGWGGVKERLWRAMWQFCNNIYILIALYAFVKTQWMHT